MRSQTSEAMRINWWVGLRSTHEGTGWFVDVMAGHINEVFWNDRRLTEIDGPAINQNINKFLERYQNCSLATFLSLLFNPKSDYYDSFPSPWTSDEFERWGDALNSLIDRLLDERVLLSGSARDQYNIRSAMRVFSASVFSLRDSRAAEKAVHLASFWDNKKLPSRFEQAAFGIVALKKMPCPLPMDIRYRIAGFLDLQNILDLCSGKLVRGEQSTIFQHRLLVFVEFFSRVLHQTSPDHQMHLLRALSSYSLPRTQSEMLVQRVVLKILGYPPKVEGLKLPVFFSMEALRRVFGVSKEEYPDHDPRVQQLMGSFETFKLYKLDSGFPKENVEILMELIQVCSEFLKSLGVMVSFEKLASFVSFFNTGISSPARQMRSVLSKWIDDANQDLRSKLFGQTVIPCYIEACYPALSLKDLASDDQLNQLYDAGDDFTVLLKPLHDKAMLPKTETMLKAMSSVFVR